MQKIFLSFASEQSELAERLGNRLRQAGHRVFVQTDLRPGEPFDQRIRQEIEASDLFIFFISPASIAKGRYTLTELGFAESKWSSPHGSVLPVMVEPTAIAVIPSYLSAMNILEPRGDAVAEIVARVDSLDRTTRSDERRVVRFLPGTWMTGFTIGLLLGVGLGIVAGKRMGGARTGPLPVRIDFEEVAESQRWLPQDYPGMQAISSVFQTTAPAHTGTHALGANINLKGGDPNNAQGEVYGNILEPTRDQASVDLLGRQVVVWLFVPPGTVKGSRAGEVKIFLKDSQWKSMYGPALRLTTESLGHWFPLTLVAKTTASGSGTFLEPGFDPHNTIVIGVQLSAGVDPNCVYEGDFFIDSVTW